MAIIISPLVAAPAIGGATQDAEAVVPGCRSLELRPRSEHKPQAISTSFSGERDCRDWNWLLRSGSVKALPPGRQTVHKTFIRMWRKWTFCPITPRQFSPTYWF